MNLCRFNNKNVFTTCIVVYINGGNREKTIKMVNLKFFLTH